MPKITCNGQRLHTAASSLWALVPDRTDTVVILNGYQTAEDLPLHDGDVVTVIRRGQLPPPDQLEQMMAARLTPGVYEAVHNARVGIAGLGGLGSHIAYALARTGVGQLHLVDFDTVEPSNLNRQCYQVADLGLPKPEALVRGLHAINPYLTVTTAHTRVTAENAAALFSGCDIVCEAFDDPAAKAMLVDALLTGLPDVRIVAASGMAGLESANRIHTRRLTGRLYLCGDEETASEPGCGLMAPRVMICAGHQANMVLRLLCGQDMP